MSEIQVIPGGLSVDDRGEVRFVNDADLSEVKRFYVVRNHASGTVRAWHAHRQEKKLVTVVTGVALITAVEIDDWENPSKSAEVHRFVLSAAQPQLVVIPPGYANGAMPLTADATLLYLSTASVEESRADDVRFESRYWDPWSVEER